MSLDILFLIPVSNYRSYLSKAPAHVNYSVLTHNDAHQYKQTPVHNYETDYY